MLKTVVFQSPHRRGGSRDVAAGNDRRAAMDASFNPLIGGADRATFSRPAHAVRLRNRFQSPHRRGGSRDLLHPLLQAHGQARFNPLIGGADRATWWKENRREVDSDIGFQSPHRRGGSRDTIFPSGVPSGTPARFNPLIGGADRATEQIGGWKRNPA